VRRSSPRLSAANNTDDSATKKKKKKKKVQEEPEAEEPVVNEEAKVEKKKKKKKKKAEADDDEPVQKKAVHASPWIGGLPANASPKDGSEEEEEAEEPKSEKKKKKKKRKAEEAVAEEEAAPEEEPKKKKKKKKAEAAAEEAAEEQPKKKKKKKKAEGDEDESEWAQGKMEKGAGAKAIGATDKHVGFNKDFYKEHPKVTEMTEEAVASHREEWTMAVAGGTCDFKPCPKFEWLGLDPKVLKITSKFEKPTAIQAQCWPVCLAGRDCIGVAETGSGKSLGFLLPAVVHILDQPPLTKKANGPICLVLSPTRELAMQTMDVAEEICALNDLSTVCIYGGVPKGPQENALWKGVHIVVATPGRLKDLMQQGSCSLDRCTYVVLDEADRMLDAGFAPEIRHIVGQSHKQRQTLMFTATWPMSVQQMAMEFLDDPIRVTIGSTQLSSNKRITQHVYTMGPRDKDQKLQDLLQKHHKGGNKILVFALYKKEAARVEQTLARKGFKVGSIHGDKGQNDRNKALEDFKSGKIPVLVATDVAARGLDIPNVEHVINVTFPLTIEDYVHRIGRTGRGGKTGESHTFFTEDEKPLAGALVKVLQDAGQKVPEGMYSFGPLVTKKAKSNLYGDHFKEVDMTQKGTKITF